MNAPNADKNLIVETTVDTRDLCFYDVKKPPFRVYGLYDYQNEPEFKRMPDKAAAAVSAEVAALAKCPAGGRVRFSTTSRHIAPSINRGGDVLAPFYGSGVWRGACY